VPEDAKRRFARFRSGDARMSVELGLASMLNPLGGFVANIIFARTLGASGRGDLAAIVAALSVCEAVLVFGLPDILARHIAKGSMPAGTQRTLASAAIAASVLPGALVTIYCHSWHFSWLVAVAAGLIVPFTTATVIARGVLLGRQAYRKLTWSLIFGGVFRLLTPLALLLVETPTENLGLLVILSWSIAAAVPIFACRPFSGRAATTRKVMPILRESLIYWPVQMAWLLHARLDQLILAAVVLPADLGRYAVCVGIAEAPSFLASGPRQVLLARAAKTHSLREIPKVAQTLLVIVVVSGIASGFFAGPVLTAVFGAEFGGTSWVLGLLLAATGFDIALGLLGAGLVAVGRLRSAAISQTAGLLITVIFLPVALSFGAGIVAAAAIRFAASFCACLLARLAVWRVNHSQGLQSDRSAQRSLGRD
jgi:O-antigen/teichoic acid export membrane protein